MKASVLKTWIFLAVAPWLGAADDVIDRVEDALVFGKAGGGIQAKISGLVDLEGYHYSLPAPGLIYSESENLFSPRMTFFVDVQLGADVYAFVQARVDRGFDPGDERWYKRFDEYAVRYSLHGETWLNIQVGKFATVVGNWVSRHDSWTNPFITAPLVYENLTGIWDGVAASSADTLLRWSHRRPGGIPTGSKEDKDQRLPVIWGPSYGSGVALSGKISRFQYAMEFKNAALSSRPEYWDASQRQWQNPTVSGRLGYRPNEAWDLGLSASSGSFLDPSASATVPKGYKLSDYRETVIGQDLSFAWHHFQLWTEIYWSQYKIPRVGSAETISYYAEAKYKFTAQFFGAIRWNQQLFGRIQDSAGNDSSWGNDIWQLDFAPTYRFTPHTQLKLQYSLQHTANVSRTWDNFFAVQATVRF